MVEYFEEVYSLQTAWLIVMYSILGCAVVTIVVLATCGGSNRKRDPPTHPPLPDVRCRIPDPRSVLWAAGILIGLAS